MADVIDTTGAGGVPPLRAKRVPPKPKPQPSAEERAMAEAAAEVERLVAEEESGSGSSAEAKKTIAELPPKQRRIAEGLAEIYTMVSLIPGMAGDMLGDPGLSALATSIISNAEDAALAWIELGIRDPKVMRRLESVTQGVSTFGLIGVHMAMVLPLLVHRGIVPPFAAVLMGSPLPVDDTPDSNG